MRLFAAVLIALLAAVHPPLVSPGAATEPHVKVVIQFSQTGAGSRDAAQAGGRVIVTERGGVRSRARVEVDSRETKTKRTTGVFTVVRSGGESTMLVASEVPYEQVSYFRDYLTGNGYVASSVAFRQVGTSLNVAATVLPDQKIRLRVTPVVSYFTADSAGSVEITRASTELVVANGQSITIGGGTSEANTITRRILGLSETREASETSIVLIATIQ